MGSHTQTHGEAGQKINQQSQPTEEIPGKRGLGRLPKTRGTKGLSLSHLGTKEVYGADHLECHHVANMGQLSDQTASVGL